MMVSILHSFLFLSLVLSLVASQLSPTFSPTLAPTSIPICPTEWTTYRNCFASELAATASACDACMEAAFVESSSCTLHAASLCTAMTDTCVSSCSTCMDEIEAYLVCVFEALELDCQLNCGGDGGAKVVTGEVAAAETARGSGGGCVMSVAVFVMVAVATFTMAKL